MFFGRVLNTVSTKGLVITIAACNLIQEAMAELDASSSSGTDDSTGVNDETSNQPSPAWEDALFMIGCGAICLTSLVGIYCICRYHNDPIPVADEEQPASYRGLLSPGH